VLSCPFSGLDAASESRITKLIQLHSACDKSATTCQRLAAYQLAQSLPHFDRDLTAYYLNLSSPSDEYKEYELQIAHSIMRLHAPPTPKDVLGHLATWRSQGLLHVLSVAALNMQELSDWFPTDTPNPARNKEADSLAHFVKALVKLPRDHAQTIEYFIAAQDPTSPVSQYIASTLDRLAILMSVKSNARDEVEHDLQLALEAFPRLDSLEPQDMWNRIKPALERAIPPSLLRLDPSCAKKRYKQARGTW
jgi:hypothetical protein